MDIHGFNQWCAEYAPTSASGFYWAAEKFLGEPTSVVVHSSEIELLWEADDGTQAVIAWVVFRRDIDGVYYPVMGGR